MNIRRVVVVGDVVSAALDRSHTFSRIEKAKEIMDRLWDTYSGPVPYTLVMGNHDYKLDNDDDSDRAFLPNEILAAERRWVTQMRRFPAQPWKPYWQQIQSGWKFIYLDSFRGNTLPRLPYEKFRHFDEAQIDWLDCELSSGHKTLIFMHHPVATDDVDDFWWASPEDIIDETSDPDFMNLLYWYRDRVEAIFVGHGHHFMSDKLYNEIKVREVGSTAEPTPDCDHPKFIVEGRPIGYDGLQAPIVEIERGCQ
jgi:3',5'-cyclic AMP phosphodiesterase CpdA